MFKKRKSINVDIESFTPISRTKTLKGRYVPAFIYNMSYFFTKLQVYEDGLVDAWELLDLDLFKGKLNNGWVKTSIPDGEDISIHNLGTWEVKQGKWNYDNDRFYKHINDIVKSLNPEMRNLHNCYGQTTKKFGKVNTSILGMGNGKPYTLEGPEYYPKTVKGDAFSIFVKKDDENYELANLCLFTNGCIEISGLGKTIIYDLDELRVAIEDEEIITKPEQGKNITIYGLGRFVIGECKYAVEVDQFLLEVEENLKKLQGKKTTEALCRELFEQYCGNPTEELRQQLKSAYENIPEHLRVYVLGDQDRKDIPVRIAIYGEDEIKKWSHYIVAEELGDELPSIDIPKPK